MSKKKKIKVKIIKKSGETTSIKFDKKILIGTCIGLIGALGAAAAYLYIKE